MVDALLLVTQITSVIAFSLIMIAIVMTVVVRPYDVMRSNFGVCCVWRGLAEALACG